MNAVLICVVLCHIPIIVESRQIPSELNSIANKSDNHPNTILSIDGINPNDTHSPVTALYKPHQAKTQSYKPKRASVEDNEKILTKTADGNSVGNLKDEITKLKGLMKILRDQQVMLDAMNGKDDLADQVELTTKKPEITVQVEDKYEVQEKELNQLKDEVKSLKELLIKTVNVSKFAEIDKKELEFNQALTAQKQEIDRLKSLLLKLVDKQKTTIEPPKPVVRSNNKVMNQLQALEKQLEKILADNNFENDAFDGNDNVIVGAPLQHLFAGRSNNEQSVIQNLSKPLHNFTRSRMRAASNDEDEEELVKILTDRLKNNENVNPNIKDSFKDTAKFHKRPIPKQTQTENSKPRASGSSVDIDTLIELLDHSESKTSSIELDDNAALLNELQKLSKKSKKDDINIKLKKLQKQIKHLQDLDSAKSKSLDDDDTSNQIKKLKLQLKLLQAKESKSLGDDDDDLESNLKSLEKAIDTLRPKDDDFDIDMDLEEKVVSNNDKRFQLLINKMFNKNKHVQISSQPSSSNQQQIAFLIKKLAAGNRPMDSGDAYGGHGNGGGSYGSGGGGGGGGHSNYEGDDDNGYGGDAGDDYHSYGNEGGGEGGYDADGYNNYDGGYGGGGGGSHGGDGGGHSGGSYGSYAAGGHSSGAAYHGGSTGGNYGGGGGGGSYGSGKGSYGGYGASNGYGKGIAASGSTYAHGGGGYGGGYGGGPGGGGYNGGGSTASGSYGNGKGGYAAGYGPGGANVYGSPGYGPGYGGTAGNGMGYGGMGYGPTAGMYGPYGDFSNIYGGYGGYAGYGGGGAGNKYGPGVYGAQFHGSGPAYSKAPTSATYSSKVNKSPMPSYNPYSGSFDDGSLYGSNPGAGMYPSKNGAYASGSNDATTYAGASSGGSGNYASAGSGTGAGDYASTGGSSAGGSNYDSAANYVSDKDGANNNQNAYSGGAGGQSGYSGGDAGSDPNYSINGALATDYNNGESSGGGNSRPFPGYQGAAGAGPGNAADYDGPAAASAANNQQSYQTPAIDKQGYTRQKVGDLQTEIYDLQNVINGFNRPEYTQKPEDKETVYKLNKQIGDLKNVMNNINSESTDYAQPPGQESQPPQIPGPSQSYPTAVNARKSMRRVARQSTNDIHEEESREADEMLDGITSFIDNILQKDEDKHTEEAPQSPRIAEVEEPMPRSGNPELEQVKEKLIDLRKQYEISATAAE